MDEIAYLGERISEVINEDRMKYEQVYNLIEQYCADKSLIIGGKIGLYMLLNKERAVEAEMFNYEIYSENGIQNANELTNLLAQMPFSTSDVTKYVLLKTVIPNIKYTIQYDNRIMATIFSLRRGTFDIIKPVYAKSLGSDLKIHVMPGELYLIDIYRTLYTPGQADNWEGVLKDERNLFKHLKAREDIIKGSAESEDSVKGRDQNDSVRTIILRDYFANNQKIVLVGEAAASILLGKISKVGVIQILTSLSFNEVIDDLKKLLKVPIKHRISNVHIIKDFRLERMSIRVGDTEVLYVYNSAHYDLIPFNHITSVSGRSKTLFVGNPFVVMRTILIEIWIIREHLSRGTIDESFGKMKINGMLSKMLEIRRKLGERMTNLGQYTETLIRDITHNELEIFQNENVRYLGTYITENKYIKDISGPDAKKFYDYLPQKYYLMHGKYRML